MEIALVFLSIVVFILLMLALAMLADRFTAKDKYLSLQAHCHDLHTELGRQDDYDRERNSLVDALDEERNQLRTALNERVQNIEELNELIGRYRAVFPEAGDDIERKFWQEKRRIRLVPSSTNDVETVAPQPVS